MHTLREIVREALTGLARNRTRALLSMLGISQGIVSVVMLLSYGNGFRDALARGFAGVRRRCRHRVAGADEPAGGRRTREGKRIRLKTADVMAVKEVPLVKFVSPEFTRDFPVTWESRQGSYLVRGVAPDAR
ncbi:MAG: ABC transporter permease [Vicinamibacterales bacterium]